MFVGVVVIVAYGNLGQRLAYTVRSDEVVATAGFVLVGFVAGVAGQVLGTRIRPPSVRERPSSTSRSCVSCRQRCVRRCTASLGPLSGTTRW